MNREIKFRARDTRIGKWYESVNAPFQWPDGYGRAKVPVTLKMVPDGVVLMQFTGLRDKNGKEIYEGDVFSLGGHPWECAWSEPQAKFFVRTKNVFSTKRDSVFYKSIAYAVSRGEIIGNIYENPNLVTP